jgi:hypothetical protein
MIEKMQFGLAYWTVETLIELRSKLIKLKNIEKH